MPKAYLNLRTISGISGGDLEMNRPKPSSFTPGQVVYLHDSFGLRVMMVVRNVTTANIPQGRLVSRSGTAGLVHDGLVVQQGSRTHFTTNTALTADVLVGAIANVKDDAGGAGALPEGESSIVVANSASRVDCDPNYPFSADLVLNDTVSIISTYQAIDAAAGHLSQNVLGVVVAENGIDPKNHGFVQCGGVNPRCLLVNGATVGNNVALIAGAGRLAASSGSAISLLLGNALTPIATADIVSDLFTARLACGPSSNAPLVSA